MLKLWKERWWISLARILVRYYGCLAYFSPIILFKFVQQLLLLANDGYLNSFDGYGGFQSQGLSCSVVFLVVCISYDDDKLVQEIEVVVQDMNENFKP